MEPAAGLEEREPAGHAEGVEGRDPGGGSPRAPGSPPALPALPFAVSPFQAYHSLRLQDDRSSGKVFPRETGCLRVCALHPALPCLVFNNIGES